MSMFRLAVGILIFMSFQSFGAFAADQSICSPGSKVELYPNGSLMSCLLKDEFPSNGIRCKEFQPIRFYPEGQLESCNLSATATVGDQECKECWKDPQGVIKAFKMMKKEVDATLVLLGNVATDDPEGARVYESF